MVRSLAGPARLRDSSGKVAELKQLSAGKPTVVVFWSRDCGAAIEALPALAKTIPRLRQGGTPVVFVVDEGPSAALTSYLKASRVSWPVYHDVDGTARRAFGNFGTPEYYVLDALGRIRFDYADGELELLSMVDALRADRH